MADAHGIIMNGKGSYGFADDVLQSIAVVGFSFEFPQNTRSAQSLWKTLEEKKCLVSEWPKDRLNLDAFYDPNVERRDTMSVRGGYFLKRSLAAFDAPFFSITPAEAMAMDPQQRLLLETAYQALENAGLPIASVRGTKTGVYVGSMSHDYLVLSMKDPENMPKYTATGVSDNIMANRVSWFFDLKGPSVQLDSACSSSLTAVDFACQGLRNGDTSMALVGGANILLAPEALLSLDHMGFLSSDGRCYCFDERAKGYARGEGASVLVLKRVSDAIANGDTIRAIIRSTGSNQDGWTPGITQPSTNSQADLIRDTYAKAGLNLNLTRYFEAHGTGTRLGDPIEANAIGKIFQNARSCSEPLYIGSVKSNIGHLEGGSGIAGLIKTVLILERGLIPPNANFEHFNSKINAKALNIQVPIEIIPWPCKGIRRASVSSFGIGGSNSHAILEDAHSFLQMRDLRGHHCTDLIPRQLGSLQSSHSEISITEAAEQVTLNGETKETETLAHPFHKIGSHSSNSELVDHFEFSDAPKLLFWSAIDERGLRQMIEDYCRYFRENLPSILTQRFYLENLSHTLLSRRTTFHWSSSVVLTSPDALAKIDSLASKPVRKTKDHGLAFVFTGQGAQYRNMGRELLLYQTFRDSVSVMDGLFQKMGCEWSLLKEISNPSDAIDFDSPDYSQPLTTALQIALVELLKTFNILPKAAVGHSSGEIAAAYTIGAISLQSACRLSFYRGRIASQLASGATKPGAMMAVNLSQSECEVYLKDYDPQGATIYIACVNSPKNVTISGDEKALDMLESKFQADDIFARKLRTRLAYHSPQMKSIYSDYLRCIQCLEKGTPPASDMVMISSVTGERVTIDELVQPTYWAENMVQRVNFSQALSRLIRKTEPQKRRKLGDHERQGIFDFVEIGPHSTLERPVRQTFQATNNSLRYASVLSRLKPAHEAVLELVGILRSLGYLVAIDRIHGKPLVSQHIALPDLPSYPFNLSQEYWHESNMNKNIRLREHAPLDLLGTPAADWNPLEAKWRKFFDVEQAPWLVEHRVSGLPIYPGAGMIVMAIEAATQLAEKDRKIAGYSVADATFSYHLQVSATGPRTESQVFLRQNRTIREPDLSLAEFRVCVLEKGDWKENCRGAIKVHYVPLQSSFSETRENQSALENVSLEAARFDQACSQGIEKARMYEHFKGIGLDYGESFQRVQRAAYDGKTRAIGWVDSYWPEPDEENSRVQPHVVHPTTLDAIAHLMWVPLTRGATEIVPMGVPSHIKNLWISNGGLGYPEPTSLKCYMNSEPTGRRGTESSVFALDGEGNLKCSISQLKTTTVLNSETDSQPSTARHLCYNMDCKPDHTFLTSEQALTVCEANGIKEVGPLDFYRELKMLALKYMSVAIEKIDSTPKACLKPHLERYLSWMKLQLSLSERNGVHQNRRFQGELDQDLKALAERLYNTNVQGKLFVTIGRQLASIVLGEVDPLEVLFADGLADRHYQEILSNMSCSRNIGPYLDILAHKNPALRILEVGAGTGSITGHVLAPLLLHGDAEEGAPRFSQYDYTDVSGAYFESARERFHYAGQNMDFRLLDIQKDPEGQGFLPSSYDVVVACNVLHTTEGLSCTLQNLRRLLKPGGKLLLLEITEPELLRCNFAYGTLPGWWMGTESYREWSPCVTEDRWHSLLSSNGFTGVDFSLPDFYSSECHEMSLMVSTAKAGDTDGRTLSRQIVLLVDRESRLQADLAQCLYARVQTMGDSCEIFFIGDALPSKALNEVLFVFLPEVERPFTYELSASSLSWLQTLTSSAQYLLWVAWTETPGPISSKVSMSAGLTRVLRSERTSLSLVSFVYEGPSRPAEQWSESILKVLEATEGQTLEHRETELVERNGVVEIGRIVENNQINTELHDRTAAHFRHQELQSSPPLVSSIGTPGLLDTIQFVEDTAHMGELQANEIEVQVRAVGINFRDVLLALGRVDEDTPGCECAGVIARTGSECESFKPGDKVCAAVMGCMRTSVRCDSRLAAHIPAGLSFEEAAALPIAGVTAYQALGDLARLQKGEAVLIHSGAGGTGQMVIQLAQRLGAEVYTTVGSEKKRDLLSRLYEIPDDHIFNSRDSRFASGILRVTSNRGVDVVVNSLSGESLQASWETIASFGRFIEIGKADIQSNSKLPMRFFGKNVSFSALAIDHVITSRPDRLQKSLLAVMNMAERGLLRPSYPLTSFPASKVEDAFRLMQSGKNTGKIVLTLSPTDAVPALLQTKPALRLDPHATYIVAGGLGGIGRSVARWMADRGAKNIMLLSRSSPKTTDAVDLLRDLRALGVNCQTPKCDVSSAESLRRVLVENVTSPIKGCVQGTMVLKDVLFEKMTLSDWNAPVRSKVPTTWNLHDQLPADMDFFVLLSSVAGIIGSIGQANYAAGNTYQDALARHRTARGQPTVALDLGWMSEVGVIAENAELARGKELAADMAQIREAEFHALLDIHCERGCASTTTRTTTAKSAQTMVGLVTLGQLRAKAAAAAVLDPPDWSLTPLFSATARIGLPTATTATPNASDSNSNPALLTTAAATTAYSAALASAPSAADAEHVVLNGLVWKLAKALGADTDRNSDIEIDTTKPLHAFGVDSLLAVELRNWIGRAFGAEVAVFEIMAAESVGGVAGLVVGRRKRSAMG